MDIGAAFATLTFGQVHFLFNALSNESFEGTRGWRALHRSSLGLCGLAPRPSIDPIDGLGGD